MLSITAGARRLCDGLNRREVLSVGGAGLLGLALPDLLRAGVEQQGKVSPKAKSLIVFFLEGGPAHQDLWDMKPDAPAEVRGEFKPIATTVPGLSFCEHLPAAWPRRRITWRWCARSTTPSLTIMPERTTRSRDGSRSSPGD